MGASAIGSFFSSVTDSFLVLRSLSRFIVKQTASVITPARKAAPPIVPPMIAPKFCTLGSSGTSYIAKVPPLMTVLTPSAICAFLTAICAFFKTNKAAAAS